jgi:Xaa-Pro aminopeptidase
LQSRSEIARFCQRPATMFEAKTSYGKKIQPASADNDAQKLRTDQALLLVAASEGDANMLYAVGFFVPDPFIFFEHKGKKVAVMSDLEIDRAKKQARVDRVLSLSLYQRRLRRLGKLTPAMVDVLDLLFRERGIRSLLVPANFPALLADQVRAKGFRLQIKRDPFFAEREIKSAEEVKHITESLRAA